MHVSLSPRRLASVATLACAGAPATAAAPVWMYAKAVQGR
jgi:hypothetical protein